MVPSEIMTMGHHSPQSDFRESNNLTTSFMTSFIPLLIWHYLLYKKYRGRKWETLFFWPSTVYFAFWQLIDLVLWFVNMALLLLVSDSISEVGSACMCMWSFPFLFLSQAEKYSWNSSGLCCVPPFSHMPCLRSSHLAIGSRHVGVASQVKSS